MSHTQEDRTWRRTRCHTLDHDDRMAPRKFLKSDHFVFTESYSPELWCTHQGSVSEKHLDYYLDEFTFRFNRRSSRARGLLFYRLVQQALEVGPTTYRGVVTGETATHHNRQGLRERSG